MMDVLADEHERRHSDDETQDVDECEALVAGYVAPDSRYVVCQHEEVVWVRYRQ